MNDNIPEYSKYESEGFTLKNDRPFGFFIFDLVDTLNKVVSLNDCIEFKDNHIYHFAPLDNPFSFSHILILNGKEKKVFKFINCENKGEDVSAVLRYVNGFVA